MADDEQGWVPRGFVQEMRQAISNIRHDLSAQGDHLHHHDEQLEHVFDALRANNQSATELDLAALNNDQLKLVGENVASRAILVGAALRLTAAGQTIGDVFDEIDDLSIYDDLTPLNVRQEVQSAHTRLVEWLREFLTDRELMT
ncbi:hypothetical protein [Candidatus Poriferisodalis sp.]|uniref:hypothetical protein n=1 Tax=Candidatus Poriferisodalis sp. TaxID=3101277 RepID=UPI003B5C02A4